MKAAAAKQRKAKGKNQNAENCMKNFFAARFCRKTAAAAAAAAGKNQ